MDGRRRRRPSHRPWSHRRTVAPRLLANSIHLQLRIVHDVDVVVVVLVVCGMVVGGAVVQLVRWCSGVVVLCRACRASPLETHIITHYTTTLCKTSTIVLPREHPAGRVVHNMGAC